MGKRGAASRYGTRWGAAEGGSHPRPGGILYRPGLSRRICHVVSGAIKKLMMDSNGEITPLTPSEMGRRGAAARWSQDKAIGKRPEACAHRAVERLTKELYQATQSRVGRDAAIPICIIREWVQLYEREKSAGNRSHAIKVPRAACRWLCLATSAPRRHACPSRSGSEFRRWRPSLVSL